MKRNRHRICQQKCITDEKELQAKYVSCPPKSRGKWGSWSPWKIIGNEMVRTRKCLQLSSSSSNCGAGTYIERKIFKTRGNILLTMRIQPAHTQRKKDVV